MHCNVLHHNVTHCSALCDVIHDSFHLKRTATYCSPLQHIVTHALQRTVWRDTYDIFHWKCYIPNIRIQKLRLLGISRYHFKLRFRFNLNLYLGICVSGFGRFLGCSIFRGNCHSWSQVIFQLVTVWLTFQYVPIFNILYVWLFSAPHQFSNSHTLMSTNWLVSSPMPTETALPPTAANEGFEKFLKSQLNSHFIQSF